MNIGRIITIVTVIFLACSHLLLTVHHAVKIRLGDTQEGWSLTFVFWMIVNPIMMAVLIEVARKIKD